MTIGGARALHEDRRGAIMLMGLFMSCFLIGGLWFLIGIGDAIVFRDQMQEATDHAAFASAIMHAKGMNFISSLNIILLTAIAIHIVLGLIHDILLAVCILSGLFTLGLSCTPWLEFRPVYTNYAKVMKKGALIIHPLEQAASIAYPYIGLYKANRMGRDYGNFGPTKHKTTVVAFSTSLVPGGAIDAPINQFFNQTAADKDKSKPATGGFASSKKHFLPVESKHFDAVCEHIASNSIDFLLSLTGMFIPDDAMAIVRSILRSGLVLRYCNDLGSGAKKAFADATNKKAEDGNKQAEKNAKDEAAKNNDAGGGTDTQSNGGNAGGKIAKFISNVDPGFDTWWGKDGLYLPWGGTANGSPWQQIWAVNIRPEFADAHQRRVHIAVDNKPVEQDARVSGYVAQAEFFYDCTATWSDCNVYDNAGYAIKWRARLRRFQLPQVGGLLTSYAGQFLKNMTKYGDFKKAVGSDFGDYTSANGSSPLGAGIVQRAIDDTFKGAESEIKKGLGAGGNAIDGALNNAVGNLGSYH